MKIIQYLLSLLAPSGSDSWLVLTLSDVLGELPTMVETIQESKHLSGEEKREYLRLQLRTALDSLDHIPGWAALDEDVRDRMLDGWIETAWQIQVATDGNTGKVRRQIRRLIRQAR